MKYTKMQIQRIRHGMTQESASRTLGISRSYLSQLECSPEIATEELLVAMEKLYGCYKSELL